jgi:hypothetical protein
MKLGVNMDQVPYTKIDVFIIRFINSFIISAKSPDYNKVWEQSKHYIFFKEHLV